MTPADRPRRRRGAPPPDSPPPPGQVPGGYGDEIDWFAQLRSAPSARRDRQAPRRDPGDLRRPPPERGEPVRRPDARRPDGRAGGPQGPQRPDDREWLAPGQARIDDAPARGRRAEVIDGEVTGEIPAVVDGEVTGEMPAVVDGPPPAAARRPTPPGAARRPAPPGTPGPPPPPERLRPPGREGGPDRRHPGEAGPEDVVEAGRGAPGRRGVPEQGGRRTRRGGPPGAPPSGEPGRRPGRRRRAEPADETPPGPTGARPARDVTDPPPARTGAETPPADHPAQAARTRPRAGSTGPRRGRAQARAQLRQVERLRMITLICVTLVLLGSLPGFFLIRYATKDPGFRAMDGLAVPTWAARNPVDQAVGNRWCIQTCRVRQRLWESDRELAPTLAAYQKALADEGWKRWHVANCPARNVRGNYTCWRRDAYTLDLWVRAPQCRKNGGGGAAGGGTGNRCPESLVTVVIRNAGADHRLK